MASIVSRMYLELAAGEHGTVERDMAHGNTKWRADRAVAGGDLPWYAARMVSVDGGFPQDAFARLAAAEPGHYWFESRNHLVVWALGRYFSGAATFLEVGCGTGFVLRPCTRRSHTCSSPQPTPGRGSYNGRRRQVPSANITQGDARELDAHGQFRVRRRLRLLEHITDDVTAVIDRMHAAGRPGGGLLLTVPQHRWLWSRSDDVACHVRRYRKRELVARVQREGFDVLRVTSSVSLLLPVMAVSRWLDRRRCGDFDNGEFDVSPVTNQALGTVLTIERHAIRLGVSWPAGGSLLLAARKRAA